MSGYVYLAHDGGTLAKVGNSGAPWHRVRRFAGFRLVAIRDDVRERHMLQAFSSRFRLVRGGEWFEASAEAARDLFLGLCVPITAGTPTDGSMAWLPTNAAADALGVSRRTMQRWARAGKVATRQGRDGVILYDWQGALQ